MRITISILQVILLTLATPNLIYAADLAEGQLSYNDLVKLSQSEKVWFGSSHKSLPSEDRIDALELAIFGQHHHGTDSARISAISSMLNSGSGNFLMPPEAPKLDKIASSSPDSAADIAQDNSPEASAASEPPSSSNSRTRSMLRDALKLYSQGNNLQAKAAFQQVLQLDPKNSDAFFNLGAISENEGNLHNALNYYQKALQSSPDDGDIRSAIAAVQSKLGTVGNAGAKSEDTNALDNKQWLALKQKVNDAASAYKSGDYDRAISLLTSVAKETPNRADVYFALSQAYKAKGNPVKASAALNHAIALEPNNQTYQNALLATKAQGASNSDITPISQSGYDTISSNSGYGTTSDAMQQPGQVTPFSSAGAPVGWQSAAGSSQGYYGRTSGPAYYPAYAYHAYPSPTIRIQRIAIGSLAGASFGAMLGGGYRGGRVRGAVVGGLAGGLFGLLSGH